MPLPQKAVDAFIRDGGSLPADAEGFVRYAQVIVSLHDRRPVEVLRLGFFQYRALADGTLSRKHFRKIMGVIPEAAFGRLGLDELPAGVIGAEHKFAQRRLDNLSHWKPTPNELAMLRDLVNRKAGRELL